MKKVLLSLLFALVFVGVANADTFYTWRQRLAVDCTALTDGKPSDLCAQLLTNKLYACKPTNGVTCLTPGEWVQVGSTGGGSGSSAWGSITGTLSAQTDLQTALNAKQAVQTGAISGTANQVSVSANSNSVPSNITLSLPQDIATNSFPTFGGLTLTGANGVLKGASGVISSGATLNDIGSPTTSFSMASQKITNLLNPTSNQDAATKIYVDDAIIASSGGTGSWTVAGNDQYNGNSGNIGVGTITPGTKLDVNGEIRGNSLSTKSTSAGILELKEASANGNNLVRITVPASIASDVNWTMPTTMGTVGQVWTLADTNGGINWSSIPPSSGGGGLSSVNWSQIQGDNRLANWTAISPFLNNGTINWASMTAANQSVNWGTGFQQAGSFWATGTGDTLLNSTYGNVGINTLSPGANLDVFGTTRVTGTLSVKGAASTITLTNATSGTITLQATSGALGTQTLSFPAVTGNIATSTNGGGAPSSGDCDTVAEIGRTYVDTTNNRLYVCNGSPRFWDYASLTD
jgi:hypothetical protein